LESFSFTLAIAHFLLPSPIEPYITPSRHQDNMSLRRSFSRSEDDVRGIAKTRGRRVILVFCVNGGLTVKKDEYNYVYPLNTLIMEKAALHSAAFAYLMDIFVGYVFY
jgi:hypothetical protein